MIYQTIRVSSRVFSFCLPSPFLLSLFLASSWRWLSRREPGDINYKALIGNPSLHSVILERRKTMEKKRDKEKRRRKRTKERQTERGKGRKRKRHREHRARAIASLCLLRAHVHLPHGAHENIRARAPVRLNYVSTFSSAIVRTLPIISSGDEWLYSYSMCSVATSTSDNCATNVSLIRPDAIHYGNT